MTEHKPNAATRKAMREIERGKSLKRFQTVEQWMADLNAPCTTRPPGA